MLKENERLYRKVSDIELEPLFYATTDVIRLLLNLSSGVNLLVSEESFCNIIQHPRFVQHYLAHATVSNTNKSFTWMGITVSCYN